MGESPEVSGTELLSFVHHTTFDTTHLIEDG